MRNQKWRRLVFVFLTLILTFPLAGCWDRKEINQMALVITKGVDLTADNKIRVAVQVAVPTQVGGQSGGGSGSGGGKSFFVVQGTGRTIAEADLHIQQQLPRQMYLSHLRVVLIGDRMARSGMDKILDHYGRNPNERLRTTILVAKDGDALKYMQTPAPLESISGESVRKLELQLLGVNTTLLDFLTQAANEGSDQYTSAISLVSEDPQSESSGSAQTQVSQRFMLKDQAIFRDLKLVGYLDTPQSIALLWMTNRLRHVTLTADVPGTKGVISVDLTQARRRVRTYVRGDQVQVQYVLQGSAMLVDSTTGLDADDPINMKNYQAALNKSVTESAMDCLKTLFSDLNADPTGVGLTLYRQHPYDWERIKAKWREEIPNIKYSVVSEVKIIEGGKSGPPLFGKTHRGILDGDTLTQNISGSEENG